MLASLSQRLARVGRPFQAVLASNGLTTLSMMLGQVSVSWWIIHEGSAADLATYGVVLAIAMLVGMPLLSPLGDRFAKRHLLCAGLAWYTFNAILLAWLASRGQYQCGWLIAIAASQELSMCLLLPALSSVAAELVPIADLPVALNLQKTAEAAGRLIGPALAGMLLAVVGTAATLWAHAALLALAGVLAARIPVGTIEASHVRNGWWAELRAGMEPCWRVPVERGWLMINFLSWMFMFPAIGMLIPVKVHALGLSSVWLGNCEAGVSIGMLLGTLGGSQWVVDRCGRYVARVGSGVVMGLLLALAGFTHRPWLLVASFAVTGFASAVMTLVGLTHRTLARPPAFRSRMAAAGMTFTQVASVLGPALAGTALLHWNIGPVYVVFGLLTALTCSWLAWVPGFKQLMQLGHTEVENWYGRNFPWVFEAGANGETEVPTRS